MFRDWLSRLLRRRPGPGDESEPPGSAEPEIQAYDEDQRRVRRFRLERRQAARKTYRAHRR